MPGTRLPGIVGPEVAILAPRRSAPAPAHAGNELPRSARVLVCPACGSENVRHVGLRHYLLDPRHSGSCDSCRADLSTGEPCLYLSLLHRTVSFVLHPFAGAGIGGLVIGFPVGMVLQHWGDVWLFVSMLLGGAAGFVAGIVLWWRESEGGRYVEHRRGLPATGREGGEP